VDELKSMETNMSLWSGRIKSKLSFVFGVATMAVALTVFGGSSAQAQALYIDYSADAAVSSDSCYVYGTVHD